MGKCPDDSDELMIPVRGGATTGPTDFSIAGGMLSGPVLLLVGMMLMSSRQSLVVIDFRSRWLETMVGNEQSDVGMSRGATTDDTDTKC